MKINLDDFIRHDAQGWPTLTCDRLVAYIAVWTIDAVRETRQVLRQRRDQNLTPSGIGRAFLDGFHEDGEAASNAHKSLHLIYTIAKHLQRLAFQGHQLNDILWDSVVLIWNRLYNATRAIYLGIDETDLYYRMLLTKQALRALRLRHVKRLFEANAWCPREATLVADLVEDEACSLLYCAQLPRGGYGYDHTNCKSTFCHAYQINESTYTTSHCIPTCTCDFIGLTVEEAAEVVKRLTRLSFMPKKFRSIPMAIWCDGKLSMSNVPLVSVEASRLASKTSRYLDMGISTRCVAVSHVWADGLGNATEYVLPECQVSRIQVRSRYTFTAMPLPLICLRYL